MQNWEFLSEDNYHKDDDDDNNNNKDNQDKDNYNKDNHTQEAATKTPKKNGGGDLSIFLVSGPLSCHFRMLSGLPYARLFLHTFINIYFFKCIFFVIFYVLTKSLLKHK